MKAQLIATLPGITTFKNATSTFKHLVCIENSFYLVELGVLEKIDGHHKPRSLVKCELQDIVLGELISSEIVLATAKTKQG